VLRFAVCDRLRRIVRHQGPSRLCVHGQAALTRSVGSDVSDGRGRGWPSPFVTMPARTGGIRSVPRGEARPVEHIRIVRPLQTESERPCAAGQPTLRKKASPDRIEHPVSEPGNGTSIGPRSLTNHARAHL